MTGPRPVQAPGTGRIDYRTWLWTQHATGSPFAPLAKLVLSGGPDGQWTHQKRLVPEKVSDEIELLFVGGRSSVGEDHAILARKAVEAFEARTMTLREHFDEEILRRAVPHRAIQASVQEIVGEDTEAFIVNVLGVPEDSEGDSPLYQELRAVAAEAVGSALKHRPVGGEGVEAATLTVHCRYYLGRRNQICSRVAVPGTTRCSLHGGETVDPEELRECLRLGGEVLMRAAERAVDVVVDLMENSVVDSVRLSAAQTLMDRAGMVQASKIQVSVQTAKTGGEAEESPAEIIRGRLERLSKSFLAPANEVVEGEVVPGEESSGE